jgi:hypothetical protein
MLFIPYPWTGDGRCNLGLAGRVRVVCNPMVYGNITAESQSARRTNDGDELLLGGKYAVTFQVLLIW